MTRQYSLDPTAPDFGVINGVNQVTTVVAGIDIRHRYSITCREKYWIGQFYTSPEGVIDYDLYYLYDRYQVDWNASKASDPLWNDITFQDVRNADRVYESCTDKQKWNIDWVRGLAIQYGYWGFFCIDEPNWYCAIIWPNEEELDVDYVSAEIDNDADKVPVNTYEPANLNDEPIPLAGARQTVSSVLLKY